MQLCCWRKCDNRTQKPQSAAEQTHAKKTQRYSLRLSSKYVISKRLAKQVGLKKYGAATPRFIEPAAGKPFGLKYRETDRDTKGLAIETF